uniref:EGF-like domain-containing protein n=1 Tax=Parascaris univalens TaxID=6257 RepID=A0A915C3S2_PARUN
VIGCIVGGVSFLKRSIMLAFDVMTMSLAVLMLILSSSENMELGLGLCHNQNEFDCGYEEDGVRKCIPVEWKCDNLVDCRLNAVDELGCRYVHQCRQGTFACRDGECIDAAFKCNGFDDCGDGSDERGCEEQSRHEAKCPEGQFRCRKGPCITVHAKCDKVKDCPEGDDEEGCTPTATNGSCAEHEFMCDSSCIPSTWKCDGIVDCRDGNDELKELCGLELEEEDELLSLPSREEYLHLSLKNSFCNASQYLCEPGKCIPREKLCDGRKDCPKGNDEDGRCGECAIYGCSHMCTDTPDGPLCSCRKGEALAVDGRICVDVNECETAAGRVCSHKCINDEGMFKCECLEGYYLGSDTHSCHAKPDPYSAIFFSLGSEVRHMPPYSVSSTIGYGTYQHNDRVGTVVRSIAFAPSFNHLLMATSNADHIGHIHSASGGLQKCIVDGVKGIANIAVDWVTNNVYYTAQHPSSLTGVGVCGFDGRFCRLLVRGIVNDEYYRRQVYRGLVVNPLYAVMYWIDVPGSFDSSKIMSAFMDGTNIRMLVSTKLEHPQGLAMDYIKQTLYFADVELRLIEKVNVNSRERTIVTSQGVHHPYELAFFDDYVYWTDWSTEAVVVTNVNDQEMPYVVHSVEQMPYGLAVNHSSFWVPSLCTTMMVEYCEAGKGCLNGGTCVKEINNHGHVEAITCRCPGGLYGMYCELGSAESTEWLRDVGSVRRSTFLTLFFLLVICAAVYLASEKCTFIRNATDALLAGRVVKLFNPLADDSERIVRPKSVVYEAESFSNPSYDATDKESIPLSSGGAPTYNTLPEVIVPPECSDESPRFAIDPS